MEWNLALDSGGTKVRAILYDGDFRPIRTACVGSMRPNTTSEEQIVRNLDTLIGTLFQGEKPVLDRVCGVAFPRLSEYLRNNYRINTTAITAEADLGLHAAGIFGDGMLAIAGTGSKIVARVHGELYTLGGYGALISDEGSGYWLGRLAWDAAIKSYEGRGPKTLLEPLLCEKLGISDLRKGIRKIYSLPDISPAAFVASCAEPVSRAAELGDEVALELVRRTGASLAEQVCALTRLDGIPVEVPLTVSGSIWKGHPMILYSFAGIIRENIPEKQIILPKFEPIMGAMIAHYYEINQKFDEWDAIHFWDAFPEYRYTIKSEGIG